MTATLTRSRIACDKCERPLTGGVDTFGDYPKQFCFTCWHDALKQTAARPRADYLRDLMSELETERQNKEEEASDLQYEVDRLEERITAIERELAGKGKCAEEEPKSK